MWRHLGAVTAVVAALTGCAGSTPAGPAPPLTPTPSSSTTTAPPATRPPTTPPPSTPASPHQSSPPATPSGTAALQLGDRGPRVAALQARLSQLGYWVGSDDGVFGANTFHAVVALQKVAGIGRDGVVGPQTQRALAAGAVPQPRTTAGSALEVDLNHQVVLVVDDGALGAVLDSSTGGGYTYVQDGFSHVAATPVGSFTVTRRVDGWDKSPLGLLWRPAYFSGGYALHGHAEVPPYPASHGCVRLTIPAMNWLWDTGRVATGTPVRVY